MAALIGCGDHGSDIVAIWRRRFLGPLELYDDDPAKGMRPSTACAEPAYLGVNAPEGRLELWQRVGLLEAPPALVDPTLIGAIAAREGAIVAPGVIALHSVHIGVHTHVNYGASLTRTTVGDFVTIGPGAVICGGVAIEDLVLVGAGATVCDRVRIGTGCVIGAGAIVPPCSVIPPHTKVVGVWKGVPA